MNTTNSLGTVIDTDATDAEQQEQSEPARKRPGRKPGSKRAPLDEFDAQKMRTSGRARTECRQCGQDVYPLDIGLLRELVRSCRDELDDGAEASVALGRIRYLGARFDGFCGLACARKYVS